MNFYQVKFFIFAILFLWFAQVQSRSLQIVNFNLSNQAKILKEVSCSEEKDGNLTTRTLELTQGNVVNIGSNTCSSFISSTGEGDCNLMDRMEVLDSNGQKSCSIRVTSASCHVKLQCQPMPSWPKIEAQKMEEQMVQMQAELAQMQAELAADKAKMKAEMAQMFL